MNKKYIVINQCWEHGCAFSDCYVEPSSAMLFNTREKAREHLRQATIDEMESLGEGFTSEIGDAFSIVYDGDYNVITKREIFQMFGGVENE